MRSSQAPRRLANIQSGQRPTSARKKFSAGRSSDKSLVFVEWSELNSLDAVSLDDRVRFDR